MGLKGASLKPTIAAFWFLWMLPFLTSASAADFATGKRAYDQRDYATAAREWQAAADAGDAAAQFWLGTLYESGRGVERDEHIGRRWQLLAAERGYEYAQRALGWPIKPENMPYLTCTPYPTPPSDNDKPTKADSMKSFQFQVILHNARPFIERQIMSAENMSEKPKAPNVQLAVYRIENGSRINVPYQISSFGSGGDNPRGAITDQYLLAGVRIPIDETERRLYVDQFLALLSRSPGETPEKVQQARQMMLHSDQPERPSYIDNMMPNRLGTYEVVCRYQSQNPGFWPNALEAPALRFEYVRTMNWIEVLTRKRETPK